MSHTITIVGLGNYGIDELPLGVYRFLQQQDTVYARTLDHPVIHDLKDEITFESFDDIYEAHDDFESVYEAIVEGLFTEAKDHDVTYAVPGHPRVLETTTTLLLARSQDKGVNVEIYGGKSFIDDIFSSVNIDPTEGFTLLDGTSLTPNQCHLMTHTLITQVYSSMVASDIKLTLMERYPDDYDIQIIDGARADHQQAISCPLYELDHYAHYNNLTSVFIPKVTEEQDFVGEFSYLEAVIDLLVDDEKGCPWDKVQTHDTLKRYLLEETFELFEAIDNEDDHHMIEELGDVLLQVMLHASIGKKDGYFDVREVVGAITEKMIARHPHIFGDKSADSVEDVNAIWRERKLQEGKPSRVKFEKVFATHFLEMYDGIKNKDYTEASLKRYLEQGGHTS
ncbi:MazG nucleotide pyrophosphohydrolase domain-containing protein [Staphylococcus massiliensis]|uniref:Putative nucleoside triphosphate pyrophosphohydrolase n=1 Tax=Staphylococcus massiliensis S46 TaxID=1229783 RepID=K9AJ81_9STAP|nr:MazG nucleotide pyrophosphohydrolase domain-containing protein [Staphylococcus massiliensis]EKU46161.1 putative nucleoside triphosphate pyrophosphohydrolase [Staphylococcus massiliensis S46]MCG3400542.1 nucleotide pyrophosphohydrolase [Staphylococcus massiliensis]MCG3402800.1 nucleotide pyrophosphohydrolase [Staphylococcus massiliensis]MCG3413197.1 nucleotide pyrophosphohydrolase [Staphylococcus massiliensis]POA01948.1 nucleotide pyrophosphohydrolase [Staphylococcus massiliensis CCUG 55927]